MIEPKHVEEQLVRKGDLNMRLIINHRHRHLRFMDFRVGNYDKKCALLDEIVAERGLRKAFTLVEKQDTGSWRNAGFVREGVYPSFFRTADAYIMSRVYDKDSAPLKTYPGVQKNAPQLPEDPPTLTKPDRAKCQVIPEESRRAEIMGSINGPQLGALPFGRASVPDFLLHAKARKQEGWACAEIDDSFGHAVIGFAPAPTAPKELKLTAFSGQELVETLTSMGVNNLFGLSPSQAPLAIQLFTELEFRVTGRLACHLDVAEDNGNALVWHRRLAAKK